MKLSRFDAYRQKSTRHGPRSPQNCSSECPKRHQNCSNGAPNNNNLPATSAAAGAGHHQPYSTSAGSGGSGENSAGYEDDFPELTTSKFNSLRLTDDASPTSTPNELSGRGGAGSAFAAF